MQDRCGTVYFLEICYLRNLSKCVFQDCDDFCFHVFFWF